MSLCNKGLVYISLAPEVNMTEEPRMVETSDLFSTVETFHKFKD